MACQNDNILIENTTKALTFPLWSVCAVLGKYSSGTDVLVGLFLKSKLYW
jgi:hypothetical protein